MSSFPEAKRMPGSEWLKDHPRMLETLYTATYASLRLLYPLIRRLNPGWAGRVFIWGEELTKGYFFNCQMCGQCILHSTGMTCPMNCPKNLRNGPCGGVRQNGHCEVIPEMPCVWVQAWQRDSQLAHSEIQHLQPPLNRQLTHTSAWLNLLEGTDAQAPAGWSPIELELK